ncbi:alpha/beta fold hydrolase [Bacillus norwichensis]|uniref:Alpha/beta hydrolase n=1 Tax=Bacillus norwichensis TaxID=2762217 RepID=A0ABR8VME0_9BACI|nr:alpha/beta hydrolase [Bacillus norwichensis]MBD8005939.1 alpha/beta hydrolase [Bacillus norwichensis]
MGQYITTNKGRNFYVHETPGEQGTIIGSHGLTGNHKQLQYYQEAFSGTYRFISYDILGRGNSGAAAETSSIETHADHLLDLIATLEIERPILLGYSMGAYISAIVASQLADTDGLILLDGAGQADESTKQLVLPSLERLKKTYSNPNQYVEEAKKLYTRLNIDWDQQMEEAVLYEIAKDEHFWRNKSNLQTITRDFESFYTFKSENVFAHIECPAFLLIATGSIGDQGPLFKEEGYAEIKKQLSRLQTEVTPVNHYELVFNKQPKIISQIEAFLSQKGVKS